MQLVFYDRQAAPALNHLAGPSMLSIDRKGVFSFSVQAVADLRLTRNSQLVLARDLATNAWFVLLEPLTGHKPFGLKPRDKEGSALVFHSVPQARAYWQAHGLNGQKSVRALVSATAVEHDGLTLYPLTPQHPTVAAAAALAAPVTTSAEVVAEAEVTAALVEEAPVLPAVASEPAPVASAPASEAGETTDERLERLTDHWFNLDIRQCPDAELAELVSLLADKPKRERDIVENQMLNRGKTEVERRKKKGGSRG